MWEPEHVLSVGIESGYYRLYTLTGPDTLHANIANSAIPIQLVISMKFLKSFYFNFSMGQSKLINKVPPQMEILTLLPGQWQTFPEHLATIIFLKAGFPWAPN